MKDESLKEPKIKMRDLWRDDEYHKQTNAAQNEKDFNELIQPDEDQNFKEHKPHSKTTLSKALNDLGA